MDDTFDKLDRATMTTWRLSNYAIWIAVALAAALVFHQVVDQLTSGAVNASWSHVGSINLRPVHGFGSTFWGSAPRYSVYAATAIIAGLMMATIVAKKAAGRQGALASVAATAYVLISWLFLQTTLILPAIPRTLEGPRFLVPRSDRGFPTSAGDWGYSVIGLLALIVAAFWSRFLVLREERRLSSGTP
jgi:hypothetical protein